MPELPDLTVVAEELVRRVAGRTVVEATAPTPILLRATPDELSALAGASIGETRRRGKFLLIPFARADGTERILAANAKPALPGPITSPRIVLAIGVGREAEAEDD